LRSRKEGFAGNHAAQVLKYLAMLFSDAVFRVGNSRPAGTCDCIGVCRFEFSISVWNQYRFLNRHSLDELGDFAGVMIGANFGTVVSSSLDLMIDASMEDFEMLQIPEPIGFWDRSCKTEETLEEEVLDLSFLHSFESDGTEIYSEDEQPSLKRARLTPSPDTLIGISDGSLAEIESMRALLRAINSDMGSNTRGDRDFEGLRRKIRSEGRDPCLKRFLNASLKQKVKNLMHERRKRAQLDFWREMKSKSAKMGPELRERLPKGVYEDEFVAVLADYLAPFIEGKKAAPSTLLDWPTRIREIVLEKIVQVHQNWYGPRIFKLYEDLGILFSLGELQLAVLCRCNCSNCIEAWNLNEVDRKDLQAVKLHWTKEMAALLERMLQLHVTLGFGMYKFLQENEPKLLAWTHDDINVLLKSLHKSTECNICKHSKRRKI